MRIVSLIALTIFFPAFVTGCNPEPSAQELTLKLGDPRPVLIQKMRELDARDVTSETTFSFTHAIIGEQEYSWWQLKDKTIVAVLLAGDRTDEMTVAVIEIGEPGRGVRGIANWRQQKLKRHASF